VQYPPAALHQPAPDFVQNLPQGTTFWVGNTHEASIISWSPPTGECRRALKRALCFRKFFFRYRKFSAGNIFAPPLRMSGHWRKGRRIVVMGRPIRASVYIRSGPGAVRICGSSSLLPSVLAGQRASRQSMGATPGPQSVQGARHSLEPLGIASVPARHFAPAHNSSNWIRRRISGGRSSCAVNSLCLKS